MNPHLKRWLLAVFLVGIFDVLHGLRFEQLVKFSCEICAPETDECCVGTVIHKDVILTTSYCATSCQAVHKYARAINIIRTYKQPRMETKQRHDIALVIINIDWKLRWTAQLSTVDTLSAIGLKAFYPYMEDGNTRMREMVVSTCGKPGQHIYGHHVCGVKTNSTKPVKKCFQRQGVPLVLNGKVMAITAATNNKLCSDEQIVFNTIDTELSWINSTIAQLYPDDRANEIEPEPIRTYVEPHETPMTMATVMPPTFITTMSTTETPLIITTPEPEETTKEPSDITPARASESTQTVTNVTITNVEYVDLNVTVDLVSEPPLEVAGLSTTEPALSIFSTQTDAMEWFNQKVRNKLKSGNHSYFVLTTVKQVYNTPFVDLTV